MREVRRAYESGVKLVVLIEHGNGITSLTEAAGWLNPIRDKHAGVIQGRALVEKMQKISRAYGVRWEFCGKEETGRKIIEILEEK